MPSPKSGNAGSVVSPTAPTSAQEADDSIAGSLDQLTGAADTKAAAKLGSVKVDDGPKPKPYKKDPAKKSWIEIVLVDEDKNPVPGEKYRITLPDGQTVAEGTLDDKGFARVDGIDPGTCQITFPELDKEAWEKD